MNIAWYIAISDIDVQHHGCGSGSEVFMPNLNGVKTFEVEVIFDLGQIAKSGEKRLACYWDGDTPNGCVGYQTGFIHLIDAEHIAKTNNYHAWKVKKC